MSGRWPLGLRPAAVPEGFPGRVDFLKSAAHLGQAPHTTTPEIAMCGRSNVGKSSLINVLTNRTQLARVSQTPGRTRLINFFNVQDTVTLVDLPGYGWATAPKAMRAEWGETIQAYLRDRPQLCLTVLLVDLRRDPEDEERDLLAWFKSTGQPCVIVATKKDKLPMSKHKPRAAAIARELGVPPGDVILFSALDRSGKEAVWATVLAVAMRASSTLAPAADPVQSAE